MILLKCNLSTIMAPSSKTVKVKVIPIVYMASSIGLWCPLWPSFWPLSPSLVPLQPCGPPGCLFQTGSCLTCCPSTLTYFRSLLPCWLRSSILSDHPGENWTLLPLLLSPFPFVGFFFLPFISNSVYLFIYFITICVLPLAYKCHKGRDVSSVDLAR